MKQIQSKITLAAVLQQTFLQRQAKNPNYSLRSFARQLAIGAPALSEILQGKRKVSQSRAEKLLSTISLDDKKKDLILKTLDPSSIATPKKKRVKYTRMQLDADQYQTISDWQHYAILSLIETKSFKSDPQWIAKRLGITVETAEDSLQRLERLNSIKRTAKGKIKLSTGGLNSSDNVVDLSVRKSHYQNLELAKRSLDLDDIQKRDFMAITMAVDAKRLAEAKLMIREFRDKICRFLEGGHKGEVYRMCIQLFPLSKTIQGDLANEQSIDD